MSDETIHGDPIGLATEILAHTVGGAGVMSYDVDDEGDRVYRAPVWLVPIVIEVVRLLLERCLAPDVDQLRHSRLRRWLVRRRAEKLYRKVGGQEIRRAGLIPADLADGTLAALLVQGVEYDDDLIHAVRATVGLEAS